MATSSSTYARARHGSASSQFHASRSSRKCCSQSRGDRCMARGRVASGEVCCFILCGWNHFRLGLCDYPTVSLHAYRPFHRRVPSVVSISSSLGSSTASVPRDGEHEFDHDVWCRNGKIHKDIDDLSSSGVVTRRFKPSARSLPFCEGRSLVWRARHNRAEVHTRRAGCPQHAYRYAPSVRKPRHPYTARTEAAAAHHT